MYYWGISEFTDAVRTINAKKLTPLQWEEVLRISRGRRDFLHPCPICLERFGLKKQQVILSCSHAFHKLCLQSFEKFSRIRCCPICRAEPYQKNVHVALSKALCAERIQSAFRGYYVRKKYSHLLPCRRQCFLKMVYSLILFLSLRMHIKDLNCKSTCGLQTACFINGPPSWSIGCTRQRDRRAIQGD